jgi:hypothetical protein
MAVGVLRTYPGLPAEVYDALLREMDLDAGPASGLIFHVAGPAADGSWREFDVWESRAARDIVNTDRDVPAPIKVLGEDAVLNGPPPPEPQDMDVHHLLPEGMSSVPMKGLASCTSTS